MVVSKTVRFGLALMAASGGAGALAQGSLDTQVAERPSLLPGLYSKVQARYYFQATYDETDANQYVQSPALQTRAYLGSKFFDDRLDTFFVLGMTKTPHSTRVSQRRPEWYTEIAAVDTDYASVTPYVDIWLPFGGSGTTGYVGTNFAATQEIGPVSIKGAVDVSGRFDSAQQTAEVDVSEVENPEGLGLTRVERDTATAYETPQEDQDLASLYELGVTYKPVEDLTLGATTYVNQAHRPTYTADPTDGNGAAMTYKTHTESVNRLLVSYNVGNGVSLSNEFYHSVDGLYESGRTTDSFFHENSIFGGQEFLNLTKVSYDLF